MGFSGLLLILLIFLALPSAQASVSPIERYDGDPATGSGIAMQSERRMEMVNLILNARRILDKAENSRFQSSDAVALVNRASIQLPSARQALDKGNFDEAIVAATTVISLVSQGDTAEASFQNSSQSKSFLVTLAGTIGTLVVLSFVYFRRRVQRSEGFTLV